MDDRRRQRLFLRAMTGVAVLALADGILEFCLSGAIHQLTLAIVMLSLITIARWWWRRSVPTSHAPFIPPQAGPA